LLAFLRVERNAALLLLIAAGLGLWAANSPLAGLIDTTAHQALPIKALSINLDLTGWLGELFMGGFFLLIGLELKRELHTGMFRDRRAIAIPALAALFGALVPALLFWLIVPHQDAAASGWPIPMATDVTFALAIFAVFGKAMPKASKTFLLSFAVIDDVIAIAVIAVFLGSGFNIAYATLSAIAIVLFGLTSRKTGSVATAACIALALVSWYFTLEAGIQPAVVGVILGLAIAPKRIQRLEERIHPWVSLLVLPLFAFFAAGVSLGSAIALTTAMSVAILLRPIAKIVGINMGVFFAKSITASSGFESLKPSHYLRISTLGGIGFTVALLVSRSVFSSEANLANQAILATLIAMAISMIIGAVALARAK